MYEVITERKEDFNPKNDSTVDFQRYWASLVIFIIMTQNLICSKHFLFYDIVYHGMLAINYFKLKWENINHAKIRIT